MPRHATITSFHPGHIPWDLGKERLDMVGNNYGHLLKGKPKSEEQKKKMKISKLGEKNPNWKNGTGSFYRRIAYETFGYKCNRCEITDKRLLLVHHKNCDRQNNVIENLEILCRNCHWIEHHKGDKN